MLRTGESGANLGQFGHTTPEISVILLTLGCERSMIADDRR